MTIDEKIKTARMLGAEAQTREMTAIGMMLGLLGEIEEELVVMRNEAARRDEEFLTEKQVAEIMQVSVDSIAAMRSQGKIRPSFYVVSRPRYARSDLKAIFQNKPKLVKRLEAAA